MTSARALNSASRCGHFYGPVVDESELNARARHEAARRDAPETVHRHRAGEPCRPGCRTILPPGYYYPWPGERAYGR